MHKRFYLFGTCLMAMIALVESHAQNTFPANGNVGIGTTSPGYTLTISNNMNSGNIVNVNSTYSGGEASVIYSSSGQPWWVAGNGAWGNAGSYVIGGGTNEQPKFVINPSGYVGLGTTTPIVGLDINSGVLHVSGSTNPTTTSQGAYLGWNALTSGTGETDLINNQGLGPGGFAFMNTASTGSPRSTLMFITGAGAVGIGTTSPAYALDVQGQIHAAQGVVFPDGSVQSAAFSSTLCGGDYAESVDVTGDRSNYEPGDVLVADPNNAGKFLKGVEAYSTAVMGVYSTKPGLTGRRQATPKKADEVPMAMVGIVPVKVSAENGPIRIGDLLVSSSTSGYAMKGTDRTRITGAIIGKALGTLDSGLGVIEAGITLQ